MEANQTLEPKVGGRFYLIMAALLTAIVVFGFSHTVPRDFAVPGFPVTLVLHGVVFGAWMLLFVAQPALVSRGSLALHRKLGWLGAALAGAMMLLGLWAVFLALRSESVPPFYPHRLFLVRGVFGLVVFGGLVLGGVLLRRQSEWHKRLLLCASVVVIDPGLERAMPLPLFGASWPFVVDGVIIAIALIGPMVDLSAQRRIQPAYVWGVGAILAGQIAVDVLAASPITDLGLSALGVR